MVSTPVGPLGSGLGGGVELTLLNMAQALHQRGSVIQVLAPEGSERGGLPPEVGLVAVPGSLQPTSQSQGRDAAVTLGGDAVLANLWAIAQQQQQDWTVILNFAYDWLPFYLTPFFQRPVAHLVSMGSLSEAMDRVIGQTLTRFPQSIAVHSQAQAQTFPFSPAWVLGNGFDLALYQFQPRAEDVLGWVGRIAPEKGLEDAIAAAALANRPLKVWGAMQYPEYWEAVRSRYPEATVSYCGFKPTAALQAELGHCQGLLVTPKWEEAFGNVAVEALACGVPVIAFRRGGPAEIVQDGETGWLVEPDSVTGLGEAIAKLGAIQRRACRQRAEAEYSLEAMGARVEAWLQAVTVGTPC